MRLDLALLCDFASVREGLLHILGGGITRIGRAAFPTPLEVHLAVRFVAEGSDGGAQHTLEVVLASEDGGQHGKLALSFVLNRSPDARPGEPLSASVVLPVNLMVLPKPDVYRLEVALDGAEVAVVSFVAEAVELTPSEPPRLPEVSFQSDER